MNEIHTDNAPTPRGHYAQGVAHNGFLYVSTQLPLPPKEDAPLQVPSITEQAEQVLANVLAVVVAAGGTAQSLLRVTVYVSDIAHWPEVNAVYERLLADARPARGVIPTGKLHLGYDVAADAVAALPN